MALAKFKNVLLLISLVTLISTSIQALADQQDPYEKFNRASFAFNQKMDEVILTPVAKAYRYVLPEHVRTGVTNFYDNLDEVPSIANDLLQGSLLQALNDSWRLFLNSTIGVFGIFDVATAAGLPAHYSDFGLTLAKWGCQQSNYLVIPFFGPGTVRDQIAVPINYYLFSVYIHIHPISLRWGMLGLKFINLRANALDFANVIQQAAFDPYEFQKNAYLQRRNYLIQQTLAEKPFYIPEDTGMPVESDTDTDANPIQSDQ